MSHGGAHTFICLGRMVTRKETYKKLDKRIPVSGYRTDLKTGELLPTKITILKSKISELFQKPQKGH